MLNLRIEEDLKYMLSLRGSSFLTCCEIATLNLFLFIDFIFIANGGALFKHYIIREKFPATTKCVNNATLSKT